MKLLDAYDVAVEGAHAVVIGRSPILGKPAGMMLLARNGPMTIAVLLEQTVSAAYFHAPIMLTSAGARYPTPREKLQG